MSWADIQRIERATEADAVIGNGPIASASTIAAWQWEIRDESGQHVCWTPADPPTDDEMKQYPGRFRPLYAEPARAFQARVHDWMVACFSTKIATDIPERNHRFLEEALELVQSLGCAASEAHRLVDYVFGRPVGEPRQEMGGVMVTLAALANCHVMYMTDAAETELARVWTKIEAIRKKQAAKPKHSPLPSVKRPPRNMWKLATIGLAITLLGAGAYYIWSESGVIWWLFRSGPAPRGLFG